MFTLEDLYPAQRPWQRFPQFPEVLTLGLHACPHKSQRVTGKLPTGTGDGATSQQNKDSRVSAVNGVALQPGIF